jgi:hypothetical protein
VTTSTEFTTARTNQRKDRSDDKKHDPQSPDDSNMGDEPDDQQYHTKRDHGRPSWLSI